MTRLQTRPSRFDELSLTESPDAVLIVTPDGQILHWNAGAEQVFGYPGDEVVGQRLTDLTDLPDDRDEIQRQLAETMRRGSATFESLRRRRDGTRVYVDISSRVVMQSSADPPLVLLTMKNVTALRIRRDSKQVEARFRDLLESTPDGIVMVNPTGHIVFANTHAHGLFGYGPAELRGEPVERLLPARFHAAHLGHRSKYFAQPRTRAMGAGLELFGLRKDGSEFPVEISLSPLQMEETSLVMSAIRDLSGRKRIDHELRDKNVALENASRAKDRFLAGMSHELRTPLNAIIGFTGTLLMKLPGPLNAEQEKQLATVKMSAEHLLSLINDLLDVAKIAADKQELERQPTDCCTVVQEVAATLRQQAEQKGLRFAVTLPRHSLMLLTDRRALSQIVLNLADNAVKFTERGRIHLKLEECCHLDRQMIEISVEDTGLGIRAEDQARLFEAFSRFEAPDASVRPGTGLGLHLSRRLAGLLGGSIRCRSEPGKGSVFTLALATS
jgi:PAS domain S-box-containing protein